MTNPLADPYLVLMQVYSGGKYFKQALKDTPVEPLNRARTTKICYGVLERDVWLNYVIAHNVRTSPKAAIRLILKIALYMLEYMGKHDYMVVDSAVELVKKLGKGGAAGFVNSFLRGYTIPPLPEKADEALALRCSVPLWLAKKLRRSYKGDAESILSTPSAGLCVRFVRNAEKYLSAPHTDTPFDGVYIFPNFVRDEGFFAGDYTFQSVGSVAICDIVSPCDRLFDACAAPGGKSVLLSSKCREVFASELHLHRKQLIDEYVRRMGVTNVRAVTGDATAFNPAYQGAFDAVLCDCPCSGTGVINENPDILLNRKEGDIASLVQTQKAILDNCSRYVAEGGRLYYSTCSVLPEENDSVAHDFLVSHPEFEAAIPSSPLGHIATKYGVQFLPHLSLGAGFYITSFVRK